MKGLQIFTHSLRQVTGNLRAAIKVSGLLYSVQFILAFALGNTLFADEAAVMAAMETGEFPWTTYLLVLAITLTTSIWIAVGWHRYVLKVEQPGLLPEFHADRFLGYFGKSLLIGLIVLPLAAILGTVASIVLAPLAQPATSLLFEVLIGLVVYLPVAVVALRLSAILPGVAFGAKPFHKGRLGCNHGGNRADSAGRPLVWCDDPFSGNACGLSVRTNFRAFDCLAILFGLVRYHGRSVDPDHALWSLH